MSEKIFEIQGQALVELTPEDSAFNVVQILLRPKSNKQVELRGRTFVKRKLVEGGAA
jgi:hypothetical protein